MKKREKIMGIRKQSGGGFDRNSLWFMNEETAEDFFPIQKEGDSKKRNPNDEKSVREKYEPGIQKSQRKNKLKKDCSFVVDWQLSDQL